MKVSIIIPTLGRKTMYFLVNNLLRQSFKLDYEIILIPQYPLKADLLNNDKIRIHYEPLSKGFAYYRNAGIKLSKGDIIVFIDDDEIPMDFNWLNTITKLIRNKEEQVVTAGVKIKLGQGYFTDSISLLGFPGGGAWGFEVIWPLREKDYTDHLCSGNMAINKKALSKVGNFSEKMIYGSEDMDLGKKLLNAGMKIRYLKEATVYHEARGSLAAFLRWNFARGKSAASYMKIWEFLKRFSTTTNVLIKIKKEKKHYFLGSLLMASIKHIAQIEGFLLYKINSKLFNKK